MLDERGADRERILVEVRLVAQEGAQVVAVAQVPVERQGPAEGYCWRDQAVSPKLDVLLAAMESSNHLYAFATGRGTIQMVSQPSLALTFVCIRMLIQEGPMLLVEI